MSPFQRSSGRRLLVEALNQQRTLRCCGPIISRIAAVASVKRHRQGSRLIAENSIGNSLAFILRGRVDILVKGRKIAERSAGQHVGELSIIDPSARRAATVIAAEDTDVAWVEEHQFTRIAKNHATLWRSLAIEIAERLRQRRSLLRDRNAIPELFIGSSTESLHVANAVSLALPADQVNVRVWDRGVFGASRTTIESLETLLPTTDFAILILTAEDKLTTRKKGYYSPRDNVVFELGLFMGAIGRDRTFMLVDDKSRRNLRLPPDLHGVTHLKLNSKNKKTLTESISRAVSEIQSRISELQSR